MRNLKENWNNLTYHIFYLMNGDVDAFKFYVDSFENRLVNSLEIGRRLLNIDVSHGQETVIVRTRL